MFKYLKNNSLKFFFDKSLAISFFFSIIVSLALFYLSQDQNLWFKFWGSLSIPPQPPFSDLKAHIHFYNCFQNGIDVFSTECHLIPKGNNNITTHPKIWLYLVNALNLNNIKLFNFFVVIMLIFYFYFIFRLFKIYKSYDSKIFLLLFLFSTTNFILIERFSTDLIIFLILYPIIIFRSSLVQFFLIFIGTILKYYPVFLLSIFIDKKKIFLLSFFLIFIFLIFFYLNEINSVNQNLVEMALFTAYGSRTMLKALFHLSENYNFFLNNNNLGFFRNLTFIFFFIYSTFLITIGYIKSKFLLANYLDRFEKFFLIGASIYIGTFIIGANADYRLIFLIFTIPYVLDVKNILFKYFLIFSYIISINSFLFQSGDILSYSFFAKAILVFGCKFFIFSSLLIMSGNILKKIYFFKFLKSN